MSIRSSVAALAAVVFAWVAPAQAATVVGHTLEEMTQQAPVIVRGKVIRQQYFTPDGIKRVYTDTELQVTESLKGDVSGNIVVRQPGGELHDLFVEVEGAARFVEGEEVILFVSPAKNAPGVFIPLALAASKVTLIQRLGSLRAVRRLDGLAFARAGEGVKPVGGDEDLGTAEQFIANVRRWVKR